MSIEARLDQMEKTVATLRRENSWLKRGIFSSLVVGCAVLLIGADDNKKEDEHKPITTKKITLLCPDGDPIVHLAAETGNLPGISEKEVGFSIQDANGKVRCRASWTGKHSTWGVYTKDGVLIQAMPMN